MKKIRKIIYSFLVVFIVFFVTSQIQINVNALSNKLHFVDEHQNPLGVTVTFYSDAYSRGFAWTTMEETPDSVVQILEKSEELDWSKANTIVGSYVVEDETYFLHKAHVENLEKDKEYCYRVGSLKANVFSSVGTISTKQMDDDINILFLTDPQDYDETGFKAWTDVLNAAYDTMSDVDFLACGGDIVNDSHDARSHDYDQWIYALDLPKDLLMNSVFVPTAGNHDSYSTTFTNRFDIDYQGAVQGGGYYSFDYKNMHFTVLNTNESNNMTTQIEWLKDDLERASDMEWKIVLMHKGPMSTGDHSNDSDVQEIRRDIVPIMAKYEVDLVLQGHDHVYVRTTPYFNGKKDDGNYYSGKVPNKDEVKITEIENGESITYSVEPSGTFYVTANYAGRKSYPPVAYDRAVIFPATNPINGKQMSIQIQQQTFVTIKIKDNRLYLNTYLFDGIKSTLYDTYNLIKNTYIDCAKDLATLPNVIDANILDYTKIQEAYDKYNELVLLAKKKINADDVAKLEELVTKYPLKDAKKAYSVAFKISKLGEANTSQALIDELKTIKAEYNDLTDSQRLLVENYQKVIDLENQITDLYIIQAFEDLLSAYKNDEATAEEVTRAYHSLTEGQRAKITTDLLDNFKFVEEKETIKAKEGLFSGCDNGTGAIFLPLLFIFFRKKKIINI